MHRFNRCLLPVLPLMLAAGCSSLAPSYERPALPVPAALPAAASASAAAASTAVQDWRTFILDESLRRVIQLALDRNRDLRVAVLNVERSRAQLGLAQADRWPTVGVGLTGSRSPSLVNGKQTTLLTAGLQVSNWEVDLFGRLASLDDAARAQLLASEAGRRSAELTLIAQVATSWLTLQADGEQLRAAERALQTREQTRQLTQLKADAGAATELERQTADSLAAAARVSWVQATRQRSLDLNALTLLAGGAVPDDLLPPLPARDAELSAAAAPEVLAAVPAGLGSEVLLRRPDVIQAEQALIAANANIGAARSGYFPRITLTASAGQASQVLNELFLPGHFAWTLSSQALVALFDAGRTRANVDAAQIGREAAVAQYERAVQSAFRETADALAGLSSWREQVDAQQRQWQASREIARLTELRYSRGAASELERLDAQRSLLAAEQALTQTHLAESLNRLALWKALGGGG